MDIRNLLESSNEFKSQQMVAKRLTQKWAKTGLLEGLDTRSKGVMSVLLENQAKQLISEANATNIGGATFQAGEGEQWAGVALPLVRKIFAEIAAKDFLSVQPMNLPSGLAFFLDFKYGDSRNGRKDGDNMYGNVSTATRKMKVNEDVEGGLYGAGQFGYTINDRLVQFTDDAYSEADRMGLVAGAPTTIAMADVTTADNAAFLQDIVLGGMLTEENSKYFVHGVDVTDAKIIKIANAQAGLLDQDKLEQFDKTGVRAFRLVANVEENPEGYKRGKYRWTYDVVKTWNEFTTLEQVTVDDPSGRVDDKGNPIQIPTWNLYFFVDPKEENEAAGILFHVQPVDNNRGDFEAASYRAVDRSIEIPEIDVKLASEPVVAKTRKLKAQWTPEFAQDLNAYHSIDAEAELTSILSEYISMEIDLELLDMLIQAAVTIDYWSAKNNNFWNPQTHTFVSDDTLGVSGYYNTQGGWFQTLGTKAQKISNKIHQKTLRGGANFMVTSPTVSTVLESIPGYAANTDGDKMEYAMGVQKVGSLNSRYKIYKNPYMTENIILMGYKGSQFLEAGAVYCPYVPLLMTPLVYDPETFTPRKGLMTRYAKLVLRPEFYGKLFISGLETI